jgi:hypothetical protein
MWHSYPVALNISVDIPKKKQFQSYRVRFLGILEGQLKYFFEVKSKLCGRTQCLLFPLIFDDKKSVRSTPAPRIPSFFPFFRSSFQPKCVSYRPTLVLFLLLLLLIPSFLQYFLPELYLVIASTGGKAVGGPSTTLRSRKYFSRLKEYVLRVSKQIRPE